MWCTTEEILEVNKQTAIGKICRQWQRVLLLLLLRFASKGTKLNGLANYCNQSYRSKRKVKRTTTDFRSNTFGAQR